jgi:hypothetical protein
VIFAVTASIMAWVAPIQRLYSWTESVFVTIGTSITVATLVVAIRAARARRFKEHREWMIRHVANGYVSVVSHALAPVWIAVTGRALTTEFVPLFLVAFWVNTLLAEWWIYSQRPKKRAKDIALKARPQRATEASEGAA